MVLTLMLSKAARERSWVTNGPGSSTFSQEERVIMVAKRIIPDNLSF
jgi:hypothetical protein